MCDRIKIALFVVVIELFFFNNSYQDNIRLIHGTTPNQGFIEIHQGNTTASVCNNQWSDQELAVTCKMLHMRGEPLLWFDLKAFNAPFVTNFAFGIRCHGNETSLLDCPRDGIRKVCFDPLKQRRGVSCGYPSVRVQFSNVTNQTSIAEGSSPLFALDDDLNLCFYSKMETNPWIELKLTKGVYIHTLTVLGKARNLTRTNLKTTVRVYNSSTKHAIICSVSIAASREQTFRCNLEYKTDVVRVALLGENVSLSLCRLDVFAFDSWKDAHGVLNHRWEEHISPREASVLKFNSVFFKTPDGSQGLPTFALNPFPFTALGRSIKQTGFAMISHQGTYTIGAECVDQCEVWIRRVQEPGIDERVTSDELIIKVESTTVRENKESMPKDNKKVTLSRCYLYYIKVYASYRYSGVLETVVSTPDHPKPQPFPSNLLYWVKPGVRNLQFDLKNVSRQVDLGSQFPITASYKFCCKGLICPSCPVILKLLAFGRTVTVNEKLAMNCLEYNWSSYFDIEVQPGNYSVQISYSLEGDVDGSPLSRTLIESIQVTASDVYRCDFHNGLCDGWQINSSRSAKWTLSSVNISSVQDNQSLCMAVIKLGETVLKSPLLPWNPIYKKITFCVEFSYFLPTHNSSRLEVYSESSDRYSRKVLLWLASGYHGKTWARARIPVRSKDAFKVIFEGTSTVNDTIAVAIKNFIVNTVACHLLPVYAMPGFLCKRNEFKCANGQCTDKKHRCNGIVGGCLDGSDEAGCICPSSYFTCFDGHCVKYTKLCNGIMDCETGEDERNCENTCSAFECFDGTCGPDSCFSKKTCEDGLSLNRCGNTRNRSVDQLNCDILKGICGFKSGPCGFDQDTNGSLQWTFFTQSQSFNQEILPSHDHTTMGSNGTYILLKSHNITTARSKSLYRNWKKTGLVCMQFWYFIPDNSDSSLEIIIDTATSTKPLWKTSNSTSGDWAYGQVQIPGNSPGKLFIVGHVRKAFVALDDVGFVEGGCPTIHEQDNPSCYFESEGNCKWFIENAWTSSSRHLPSMSKLYNSEEAVDSYLLLSKSMNTSSILSSPLIYSKAEGWRCLRFWFYSGKKYFERKLTVEYQTDNTTTEEWSYESETDKWTFIQLPIPDEEHLRVVIRGIMHDQGAFIALDDITFSKEKCHKIPALGNECQEYMILDETDRRSDRTLQRLKDDPRLCDIIYEKQWYRFAGSAGNQMEDFCTKWKGIVSLDARPCSYDGYRGWLNGSLSTVQEGIVKRQLCFALHPICCEVQTVARVRNCDGFYVYQFPNSPRDCSRYCTKYKHEIPVSVQEDTEWKDWVHHSNQPRWLLSNDEWINEIEESIEQESGYSVPNLQGEKIAYDLGVRFWGMTPLQLMIKGPLTEMTLCLWTLVNYTVPIYLKFVYGIMPLANEINITSYRQIKWKHICVTWQSDFGVWQTYINGIVRDHGKGFLDKVLLKDPRLLHMNLQSRVAVNTEIKISGLNIWSQVMTANHIRYMSYQCGGQESGDSLRWVDYMKAVASYWIMTRYNSTCKRNQENVLSVITNSSQKPRNVATITSPRYERSSYSPGRCLKFRYKMWGDGARALRIYQELDNKEYSKRPIWTVKDSGDSRWRDGQVTLTAVMGYRLIVEGETSNRPGILSIEGLYTTEGYCVAMPTTARQACNEILTNKSGYIMSPYYPGYYDNNVSCTWIIKASKGHVIQLEFKAFELESSTRCSADFVEVYDGEKASSASRIGRYCGWRYPTTLKSTSNTLLVAFKSDDKYTRTGFKVFYRMLKDIQDDGCIQDCPSGCYCEKSTSSSNEFIISSKKQQSVPDRLPKETSTILFSDNNIYQIESENLYNLPSLSFTDLSHNVIFNMEEHLFMNLPSLKVLRLNANFIKKIHGTIFNKLASLEALDLGKNLITTIENNAFSSLINLRVLGLHSNILTDLMNTTFTNNANLTYLYLQNNLLQSIPVGLFRHQKTLRMLKLHSNKIEWFEKSSFEGLATLEKLTLHDNPVKEQSIQHNAFAELVNLKYLSLDSFILCCYATKTNPNLVCESPGNQLSSCDDMLKSLVIRLGIWIQGIVAFLGNLAVILWWTNQDKHSKTKTKREKADVQSFLFSNLAFADLLMGVYLLFIAVHDALWIGEYYSHDVQWRSGVGCKVAGVISTLSSEASIMILVVITADRVNSILFYFSPFRLDLKTARIVCLMIWIVSSLLSFVPLVVPSYFHDKKTGFSFYGRSTVCLPLQLSTDRPAGWEYSVGIFVVFNGAAFLFILLGYLAIFIKVRQSSKRVGSARRSRRPLGKRMFFVILSDFCCWMPVVILSTLAPSGYFNDFSGKVYAVTAVFVIPLNSSINPILYTFSTAESRKKLKKRLAKLFHQTEMISIQSSSHKTRETNIGVNLKRFFRSSSSSTRPRGKTLDGEDFTNVTQNPSLKVIKISTKCKTSDKDSTFIAETKL